MEYYSAYPTRARTRLTADSIVAVNVLGDKHVMTLTQGGHQYLRAGDEAGVVYSQSGMIYVEADEPTSAQASAQHQAPDDAGLETHRAPPATDASRKPSPSYKVPDEVATSHAAAHLNIADAHSSAARRAIQGGPRESMLGWHLADVLVFPPDTPPSSVKKTKGSKTAYLLADGRQVKEQWRCRQCDVLRTVDPKVTNVLLTHSKRCPRKENH